MAAISLVLTLQEVLHVAAAAPAACACEAPASICDEVGCRMIE